MRRVTVPSVEDVAAASTLVRAHLAVTPLVPSPLLGEDVHLKLETLHPTGSFKVRGALVAVAGSQRAGLPVLAASAGNHGLGIAYAAGRLGVDATIVIPANASRAKRLALDRLPIRLITHGGTYDEAEIFALNMVADGYRFISPYNDRDVIAGNGTLALEILNQVNKPQRAELTVVCPVGGGGLASGLGLVAFQHPGMRVVGVEAEQSAAFRAALRAGEVSPINIGTTLADGLAGNLEVGTVTVEMVKQFVAELAAVSEANIVDAIRFLAAEHGIVAEGSGAVAVAALLAGQVKPASGTVVAVVTGRNIDPAVLSQVLV
jgi:threonine dehydratase